MDWKRFKNIIIVVLVIINIFFSVYYLHIKISDNQVSTETKENVISVLENNNIILEEKDFPESRKTYSACYVSRLIETDSAFAKRLKGENGEITNEDELFTITGNPDGNIRLDSENVINACRAYMQNCGIYSDMYKEETVKISGEKATVRFNLSYDNCNFFDSYIDFTVTKQGITKAEGKNIIKAEDNLSIYEEELMPVESIIVAVPKDKKAENMLKITDISFGYYLGKSAGVYVSVLSLPVWKITFSDDTFLYYDARNGNLINLA